MSTQGEVLHHPINGTAEETWEGFSWPGFFFGIIWLLIKGLYGHFLICLAVAIISGGFAAPIIWIVYGFIGNDAHKSSLLKKGYLTKDQWAKKENQSTAHPTSPSTEKDYLSQLRELAELKDKGILTDEEFQQQKTKLLGTEHKKSNGADNIS